MTGASVESFPGAAVIQAYLDAYLRRLRQRRDGTVFGAREADALVSLLFSRLGPGIKRETDLDDALEALDVVSRSALEQGQGHDVAVDIAGLAWAEAYGVLPLSRPPSEQLEWVLLRGAPTGSVKGMIGIAWRLTFLDAARPLLNWRHRGHAESERARWVAALAQRLTLQAAKSESAGSVAAGLRLAHLALEAAARNGDASLSEAARVYADALLRRVDAGTLSTTEQCHLMLIERHRQSHDPPTELDGRLVERLAREQELLGTRGAGGTRADTSPWIPLTLVASGYRLPAPAGLRHWQTVVGAGR